MTAVIYARYSSDNQREESIEGQIRECTAYAEKNGITIVKHYIDRAISAKTDNRPEFQQMIKDSDKKLFDIVLVWKLDRFALISHITGCDNCYSFHFSPPFVFISLNKKSPLLPPVFSTR